MTRLSQLPEHDAADSPHYLRALTDMADRRSVVAGAAIYNDKGIKLVEKGARIDSRLYEHLVRHKLREPIDQHLAVEQSVNAAALVERARTLAEQSVLGSLLAEALGSADELLAPLSAIPLPQPVATKLTVMREQRPALFDHSLEVALVAQFLAARSGLEAQDRVALAAAALLHDLGVLHMDPAWSDPEQKMQGAERKHLVAHPITAMLLVRDAKVYPHATEVAVFEHHERMDGTGYPRAIAGADISPLGRILLLAEVVAAFYEKYEDMPAQRLSLVLRLNHRKFLAPLVALMLPLLQEEVVRESTLMPLGSDAPAQIELLAEAFSTWETLRQGVSATAAQRPDALSDALSAATGAGGRRASDPVRSGPGASGYALVDARLSALQKALLEAGAHPRQQAELMPHLLGDPVAMAEISLVAREAMWHLQSIVNACHRRWPRLAERSTPADAAAAD